ncbi:hypothetical protein K7640_06230, partial [Micromonospora sp. PLK6-60]|nr:hypothetical protein [Micromonospora sp. PLK6-60]
MRGAAGRGRGWRVCGAAAGALAVLAWPGVAVAAPAATPVCEVADRRLDEISGMVATDDGFVMVNDGADQESHRRIFFLDARCAVVRTVRYPSLPRDTEDLAVGPDGSLWVADIGDNGGNRPTVGVWRLRPGAARPVLHRLTYPDGPRDAEALLITGDGRPLIVAKTTGRLYAPAGAPRAGTTTPLTSVGEVRLPGTTTSNPYSVLGRMVITGAATAPDRSRVVLRTYADAFEFDVPDGDVVRALTTGRPRIVPLPDEPQGESVSYSRDGRHLLTVSERAGQPGPVPVLRYALPAPPPTATRSAPAATGSAPESTRPAATGAAPAGTAGASADERDDSRLGAAAALGL